MDGIVHVDFSKEKLSAGIDAISFLTETNIFPSRGEARKMIQNGGVSVNRHKITMDQQISSQQLLHEKYLLVQKGKKNYYRVKAG